MSERGYMGEPSNSQLLAQAEEQLKWERVEQNRRSEPSLQEIVERAQYLKNPYPC